MKPIIICVLATGAISLLPLRASAQQEGQREEATKNPKKESQSKKTREDTAIPADTARSSIITVTVQWGGGNDPKVMIKPDGKSEPCWESAKVGSIFQRPARDGANVRFVVTDFNKRKWDVDLAQPKEATPSEAQDAFKKAMQGGLDAIKKIFPNLLKEKTGDAAEAPASAPKVAIIAGYLRTAQGKFKGLADLTAKVEESLNQAETSGEFRDLVQNEFERLRSQNSQNPYLNVTSQKSSDWLTTMESDNAKPGEPVTYDTTMAADLRILKEKQKELETLAASDAAAFYLLPTYEEVLATFEAVFEDRKNIVGLILRPWSANIEREFTFVYDSDKKDAKMSVVTSDANHFMLKVFPKGKPESIDYRVDFVFNVVQSEFAFYAFTYNLVYLRERQYGFNTLKTIRDLGASQGPSVIPGVSYNWGRQLNESLGLGISLSIGSHNELPAVLPALGVWLGKGQRVSLNLGYGWAAVEELDGQQVGDIVDPPKLSKKKVHKGGLFIGFSIKT